MKPQYMTDALTCVKGPLECIRYFPGQLITPVEMTQEQDYFRQKLRLHNRMLHGWGVVCGALVCPVSESNGNGAKPWHVKVTPGYILGPYGDDIVIDCAHEIDLRTNGLSGVTGEACEQALDPWCSEVTVKRDAGPLYIAVKYKQTLTRPVRVQPVGCGCDETQCEYSRCRDGYEICILDQCPENHQDPVPDVSHEGLFGGRNPPCPECPTDPWVVLAEVEVKEDGTIERIDNCSCRRVVISFGSKWWRCQGGQKYVISDVDLGMGPVQPDETRTIEILGSWETLPDDITIRFLDAENITATVVKDPSPPGSIKVDVHNGSNENFPSGSFTIEIVNRHDQVIASKRKAAEIVADVKGQPRVSAAKNTTKVSRSPRKAARRTTKKPDK